MNATSVSSTRRYDIDWLRVLLILTVFVFHSLRFFDLEDWNVKSPTTYLGVQALVIFVSRWMMPAIFLISGISIFYALGKRRAGGFVKDRALRLLAPLLVGFFTHVPFQVYLWHITHNRYSGSFWQWYPSIFNDIQRLEGNFNWLGCHLWYLEALFLFSLVCLPLFIWLRHGSGQRVLAWLDDRLSAPISLYWAAVLIFLLTALFDPDSGNLMTGEKNGGWNLLSYLVFFLSGFVLASSQAMQASIRRVRRLSMVGGLVVFAAGIGLVLVLSGGEVEYGSIAYLIWSAVSSLSGWACVLAILGYGMQRLNVRNPALDYANEAVLPFYVLHQPILFAVGFYTMNWAVPDLLKWAITLLSSFAIIMAFYELLVRRTNLLRVLFGMKPVYKEKLVQKPAVQVS